MKQRKSRARNVFVFSRGHSADALRAKLASMPPLDFDALATWLACQPEAGVILRAHALKSGLLVEDRERGLFVGRDLAEAQKKFRRLRP